MLTPLERATLMEVARRAVRAAASRVPAPPVEAPTGPLEVRAGAFVTLRRDGQLRGCVGAVSASAPLSETVSSCAVASATTDPRFAPVSIEELDGLTIEISVLGPLEAVAGPAEIEAGRHGVVVERGLDRGLLLPQVAIEWGWTPDVFVAEACKKAGLSHDAWRRDARLFRFEAEVFGDERIP